MYVYTYMHMFSYSILLMYVYTYIHKHSGVFVFLVTLFFIFCCVDMRGADATERQLRDDLMTMLIAGHETTAAMLTWATFCLLKGTILQDTNSP